MKGFSLVLTVVLTALIAAGNAASIRKLSAACAEASGPFPNPNDCSSYLQCEPSGVIAVKPCPAGLEFNPRLQVCDYPERAGCSSAPPADDDNQDPPANDDDDNQGENGDEGGDVPSPPADAPSCPAVENPEDVVQLPNPRDCSSFYKCDENGVAWLIPCPAGLEYNAKLRVCDYPQNAGCSGGSGGGNDQPADEPSNDDPANGDEDGSNNGGDNGNNNPKPPADAPSCPAVENPEDVVQLPNPRDCSSFYKCDENGVAWLIPCPAGLEYNAELRVCDYPQNAGCSAGSGGGNDQPADEPSNDGPANGDEDGGNNGNDNGNNNPQPPADAPSCPAVENPDDVIQLPNPSDCSSFYKCDENGVAWLVPCPAGLEYNAELRVCDYPANAGCSSPSAGGDQQPPAEKPSEDAPANGGEGEGNADNKPQPPADAPECPAVWDPEDVVQLPNPSDCGSFYKCDENGVAWVIPCPDGLEYNAELRVCDYPQNAGCSV